MKTQKSLKNSFSYTEENVILKQLKKVKILSINFENMFWKWEMIEWIGGNENGIRICGVWMMSEGEMLKIIFPEAGCIDGLMNSWLLLIVGACIWASLYYYEAAGFACDDLSP